MDAKPWTLPAGSGMKTVRVWFRDINGNVGGPFSHTIYLDTTKPVNGTLTIAGVNAQLKFDLSWEKFSDALSGLKNYKLVVGTAGYPACTATALYAGTETTFSHEGLTLGKTYYYRVCAVDNAGNVSTGATASKKVLPEYDPPTGMVEIKGKDTYINGDDTYTRYAAVTLKISAKDTDVKQMCVSNGDTCSSWVAYAPVDAKPWTLPAGSEMKTVRVWFRDINGNVGAGPFPTPFTWTRQSR